MKRLFKQSHYDDPREVRIERIHNVLSLLDDMKEWDDVFEDIKQQALYELKMEEARV